MVIFSRFDLRIKQHPGISPCSPQNPLKGTPWMNSIHKVNPRQLCWDTDMSIIVYTVKSLATLCAYDIFKSGYIGAVHTRIHRTVHLNDFVSKLDRSSVWWRIDLSIIVKVRKLRRLSITSAAPPVFMSVSPESVERNVKKPFCQYNKPQASLMAHRPVHNRYFWDPHVRSFAEVRRHRPGILTLFTEESVDSLLNGWPCRCDKQQASLVVCRLVHNDSKAETRYLHLCR